jgi:hypothetical protein
VQKRDFLKRWDSWLIIFTMSEDDNEGVFGPPPPSGNAVRTSQQMLGRGSLRYEPTANTLRGWAESDAAVRDILERDGLASVAPWTNDVVGAYTVYPLSSCRIGDDQETSALDDRHETAWPSGHLRHRRLGSTRRAHGQPGADHLGARRARHSRPRAGRAAAGVTRQLRRALAGRRD